MIKYSWQEATSWLFTKRVELYPGQPETNPDQWPVSRKSRKLFGPEKPFLKLRLASKFRALRRLRFENTKRTMSPEMRPKSFGTFEKRAPEVRTVRPNVLTAGPCLLLSSHTAGGYLRLFCEVFGVYF